MQFSDIPGHDELKETLRSSLTRNHMAHAQLFHGNEGGAALPLATAFASYILCENRTEDDACGVCPACAKTSKSIHPDVHFFYPRASVKSDPAKAAAQSKQWRSFISEQPYGNLEAWSQLAEMDNKLLQIGKDDAREVIKTVSMKAFEGSHKIILIWYPEMMNGPAANALLKVLEEPPANTIYLLVGYSIEQIITTITSRTQLVKVPPFSDDNIVDFLVHDGASESEARQTVRVAEGSILKARKLLGQTDELEHEGFQQWMRDCLRGDYTSMVKMSEEFSQAGKSRQQGKMSFWLNLIRESLLAKSETMELTASMGNESDFIKKFSSAVSFEALEGIYQLINEEIYHLTRNANPRLMHLNLSLQISQLLRKK